MIIGYLRCALTVYFLPVAYWIPFVSLQSSFCFLTLVDGLNKILCFIEHLLVRIGDIIISKSGVLPAAIGELQTIPKIV